MEEYRSLQRQMLSFGIKDVYTEAEEAVMYRWAELADYKEQAVRLEMIKESRAELRAQKPQPTANFCLTISPQAHETPEMCLKIIEELKDPELYESMTYCFEQRAGPDEPTKGWHIHAFIRGAKKPDHILCRIKERLAKKRGGGLNLKPGTDYIVKGVRAYNDHWVERYMSGVKGNCPIKVLHSQGDVKHRAAFGLEKIYSYP